MYDLLAEKGSGPLRVRTTSDALILEGLTQVLYGTAVGGGGRRDVYRAYVLLVVMV